jgi:hypothetical protein
MPIPAHRIAPGPNRQITPPICLGAALRQTGFAAHKVELCEPVNTPHRRAATATPNPKSTFLRIYPMNPEPAAAPARNLESMFPRIYPVNPEPQYPRQPSDRHFSRTNPPALEPAPTPAPPPNPRFRVSTLRPRSPHSDPETDIRPPTMLGTMVDGPRPATLARRFYGMSPVGVGELKPRMNTDGQG